MTKIEMASYLVSLHTLIEAQTKGSHALASATLGEEYTRVWQGLKDTIKKEQEENARQKSNAPIRAQVESGKQGREPWSREPDRDRAG